MSTCFQSHLSVFSSSKRASLSLGITFSSLSYCLLSFTLLLFCCNGIFIQNNACKFCFFSIGRVNPELYALGAGTWNLDGINARDSSNLSELEEWLLNYVNVLCINSWQVHFLYWSRILNTLKQHDINYIFYC